MLKVIWEFVKLGFKVWKVFFWISLLFIGYFCMLSLVTVTTLITRNEQPKIVIPNGELAPVAFGNPFLPYRDVTPRVTGQTLHGYTEWHGTLAGTWEGIDYSTPSGTTLYAPEICPCVVSAVGFDGWIGPYDTDPNSKGTSYILLISEDNQYKVMYQHGIYTVTPGTIVAPGVEIGKEANVGNSTGPHTHVSVKKNNTAIAANKYDNTAIIVKTGNKDIQHTSRHGNYGSVLSNYNNVGIRMSHYDPSLGGINCDSDCSTMASGDKVKDWVLGQNGKFAAACPQEWPMRTNIRINKITFVCSDRGSYINCYAPGDYDPALKTTATSSYCWIDALGSFGYDYGELVVPSEWGFIK